MTKKKRLDDLLTEMGEAESKERAAALIMSGIVSVDGSRIDKAGTLVSPGAEITLRDRKAYVSRAGHKLEAAFQAFDLSVTGKVCVDVGAATGGFTDVMLRHGASRVYCVDVGYGDLHWRIRSDSRVTPIERTNARYLEALPEAVSFAGVDVSFISLKQILPSLRRWVHATFDAVLLIKPQFEVEREEVGPGGIVLSEELHLRVVREVLLCAQQHNFAPRAIIPSPLTGTSGNQEFLAWIGLGDSAGVDIDSLLVGLRR